MQTRSNSHAQKKLIALDEKAYTEIIEQTDSSDAASIVNSLTKSISSNSELPGTVSQRDANTGTSGAQLLKPWHFAALLVFVLVLLLLALSADGDNLPSSCTDITCKIRQVVDNYNLSPAEDRLLFRKLQKKALTEATKIAKCVIAHITTKIRQLVENFLANDLPPKTKRLLTKLANKKAVEIAKYMAKWAAERFKKKHDAKKTESAKTKEHQAPEEKTAQDRCVTSSAAAALQSEVESNLKAMQTLYARCSHKVAGPETTKKERDEKKPIPKEEHKHANRTHAAQQQEDNNELIDAL